MTPRSPAAPARSPRLARSWADVLGPLAVASIVFVVFLWIRNQGLVSLTTFDRGVGSLGLLTGLLSAILMLVMVVMLARIPAVERSWGHDLLVRRHRLAGLWSFWLMIAHVACYVVERLGRSGDPLDAMLQLFVRDSWMLWATLGTACVVLVVVTSARSARRRLRYESWHLLHLYAYLGMAFALPHMIADGADFHEPWVRTTWWALYGVTAATVVVFRFGLPLARSLHHRLRVESVSDEAPDTYSVTVRGHRLDGLRTESGQFFVWRFRSGPGWSRGNPYTLSAAPTPDRLRLTVRVAGDNSRAWRRLRPGTRVLLEGPFGVMTARRRRHPRMVLLAAGVGITPFRAILEDAAYAPGEAELLYRTGDDDPLFQAELDDLVARRGAVVRYLPGPRRADDSFLPADVPGVPPLVPGGAAGGAATVADDAAGLLALVPDVRDCDLFVCGPSPWIRAVRKAARAAGVRRDQVHTEDFAW